MSLGMAFIYEGKSYIASDRRTTKIDNRDGSNTPHQTDKNKLHRLGNTHYTILGLSPLTTWVKDAIKQLEYFDISKIVDICKVSENLFRNSLDERIEGAEWLNDGTVELLSIIWANDKPEIGVMSSHEDYQVQIFHEEGRMLGKSAAKPETMSSVIVKHFTRGHSSIESILGNIFKEANSLDSAISKGFDFTIAGKKITSLYANKLTAGTVTATISLTAATITSESGINIIKDASVGENISVEKSLIFRANSGNSGIRWGTGFAAPSIYRDPASGTMDIDNQGQPIYANGHRIDRPPVAVFG